MRKINFYYIIGGSLASSALPTPTRSQPPFNSLNHRCRTSPWGWPINHGSFSGLNLRRCLHLTNQLNNWNNLICFNNNLLYINKQLKYIGLNCDYNTCHGFSLPQIFHRPKAISKIRPTKKKLDLNRIDIESL